MKRPLIAICVFALLASAGFAGPYAPVAHAAGAAVDAEVLLGMQAAGLSGMFGGPVRTEPSEYGFTWHVYSRDSRNFLMAGMRDGAVAALYSNASTLRYGGAFARGSSKSAVRAALGTPLSYVRSGNTVAVLPDRDQRDTFAVGDNYVTVFYDMISGGGVTSLMILPQGDQARAMVSKPALDAGLIAAYQRISVDLVNAARALRGLKALATDELDANLAVSRSADMVKRDYFSHYTPENKNPADLARAMGLMFTSLGENIAYGNSNAMLAFESFMNSDGHRANILKSAYTMVGAGAAYGSSRYVILTNIFSNNTAAPLSPPLSGIKLSSGQLSPAFSNETAAYDVEVPATVSKVKVTPARNTKNNKYTLINGKKRNYLYLYPKIGGSATATIVAVARDGKTKETFTVTVRRAALVTDIGVSQGALEFDPVKTSYTVSVPADTQAVGITSTAADTGVQSMTVSGPNLSPPVGGSATSKTTAVAAGGKTKLTYSVTVKREPVIAGIAVSGGKLSPSFSATRGNYTVSLPAASAPVTLTPAEGRDCARLTLNGEEAGSITLNPAIGESIPVRIKGVTAAGTESCYTVNVTRAALVTKLYSGTKGVALSPSFSPTNFEYEIRLPANVGAVSIRAAKARSGVKTMTINGRKATSYTARPPVGGSVTVKVAAVSKYGASVTYTVTVTRAAPVTGIAAGAGEMRPAFTPGVTSYDVYLPADTDCVAVTPALTASCLIANDKNNAHPWAVLSPALGGSDTVTFTASAADRTNTVKYKVTAHRAGLLEGIDISPAALAPEFSQYETEYAVSVGADVECVTIEPRAKDGCSYTIDGSDANTPAVLRPAPGETATAAITVTAPGGEKMTCKVTVRRRHLLAGIGLSAGALSPKFEPGRREYEVCVPAGAETVTITPEASPGCGYIVNGGNRNEPAVLSVPSGGSATARIEAFADGADGSETYTVTVRRGADLAGITAAFDNNGEPEELELAPDEEEPRGFLLTAPMPGGAAAAVMLEALPVSGCIEVSMKPGEDGEFIKGSTIVLEKPEDADRIRVEILCTPENGLPGVTYCVTVIWAG